MRKIFQSQLMCYKREQIVILGEIERTKDEAEREIQI